MGCCHCRYLLENNKLEGRCLGALYYCSKQKRYVNGTKDECDKYLRDYCKTAVISNEIYANGRNYCNDDKSPMFYLFILIVMIILALIINI